MPGVPMKSREFHFPEWGEESTAVGWDAMQF